MSRVRDDAAIVTLRRERFRLSFDTMPSLLIAAETALARTVNAIRLHSAKLQHTKRWIKNLEAIMHLIFVMLAILLDLVFLRIWGAILVAF
jgi:hypothetical protein